MRLHIFFSRSNVYPSMLIIKDILLLSLKLPIQKNVFINYYYNKNTSQYITIQSPDEWN